MCAKAGYDVVCRARTEQKAVDVREKIEGVARQGPPARQTDRDARVETLSRVHGPTDLAELADCDLVIEAVVEDLAVKREPFAELDSVCKNGAVLATTTSSLPGIRVPHVQVHDVIMLGVPRNRVLQRKEITEHGGDLGGVGYLDLVCFAQHNHRYC